MYTLRWSTGSRICQAVCPKSMDAWEIYWALKQLAEGYASDLIGDCYIEIYNNGIACNPKKGEALPPCKEGEGPVFILRKGTG